MNIPDSEVIPDVVNKALESRNYVAFCRENNDLTTLHDSCKKWCLGDELHLYGR
jgi:hypothetical protein